MHGLVEAVRTLSSWVFPFSDPMAMVHHSKGGRATLFPKGIGLKKCPFDGREVSSTDTETPIVVDGLPQTRLSAWATTFVERDAEAGVDGVIVVDYPPEEVKPFGEMPGARQTWHRFFFVGAQLRS